MAALSSNNLYECLRNPHHEWNAERVAENWKYLVIEVRLSGLGAFAEIPGTLNKVRGALGQKLLEGASEAVKHHRPCNWSPCCAAEVFFAGKPTVDVGLFGAKSELAKPFVLAAERCGAQDLLIRMTIFGLAKKWSQVACEALVAALRNGVHWQKLSAGNYFVPAKIEVSMVQVKERSIDVTSPVPDECWITFLTPLDTERTNISDNPQRVLEKLLGRVASMVRWYEIKLTDDLDSLVSDDHGVEYSYRGPVHTTSIRLDSGRNGQSSFRDVTMCELGVKGNIAPLWPFLKIAESTHIGRGAVNGLGRYKLSLD